MSASLRALGLSALLVAGCAGAPAATAEPGWGTCEADVSNAASWQAQPGERSVQDLDPAIHDCTSLDQLSRAFAAHPGAIPAGVDLRAYVANRCRDAASFAYPSPSCSELGAHP